MSYQSVVLADNPIRYYRLGEPSGTVATDIGSQAQNGTLSGTGITLAQTGLLTNDSNTAMLFDGATGVITLPTTGLPTGTAVWTMEAWVYMATLPPNDSTDYEIVSFGTAVAGSGPQITVNNQHFACSIWSSRIAGATALTASTIYHVVGLWDGSQVRLYVNGTQDAANALSPNITALVWANIADDNANDKKFAGVIDEVAIYSTALSPAQVATHYAARTLYVPHKTLYTGRGIDSTLVNTVALWYIGRGLGSTLVTPYIARGLASTLITPIYRTALAAEADGVGTLAGPLSLATSLTTTLAGVGTLAPTLSATVALTDTFAGVGTLTGAMTETTALTTTLAGVGTLSETFTLATSLATTLAGVGTLSATLSTTGGVSLAVEFDGVGTLSGVFTIQIALFLTCAGIGTITGVISIPSLSFLSAICVTRDMFAQARTRNMQATCVTRDEQARALQRDMQATAQARDEQANAKTRG